MQAQRRQKTDCKAKGVQQEPVQNQDYSRAHNLKDKEVQDNVGCLQEQAAPL